MARIDLLDSGPLGLGCCNPTQPATRKFLAWLKARELAGVYIKIPAITDYEVRRELVRVGASAKLGRLAWMRKQFELIDITQEALEKAADFWSFLRQTGLPTAGSESLDADAILAGMAATHGLPGDQVLVASSNVKHLARFPGIVAQQWQTIV